MVFPKKYSFGLGVYEEFNPFLEGAEDICLGSRLERDGVSKKSIRSVWVYMRNSTSSWRGAEDICLGSRLERDGISKTSIRSVGCI